jgi:hypothetical protein
VPRTAAGPIDGQKAKLSVFPASHCGPPRPEGDFVEAADASPPLDQGRRLRWAHALA